MTNAPEVEALNGASPVEPNRAAQAPADANASDAAPAAESSAAPEPRESAGEPAAESAAEAASADAPAGESEGQAEPEGQADTEGAAEAGGGEPGKRKRRRRRKGKGRGEGAEGEAAAAGEGGEPQQQRARRKDSPVAPFVRFFVGPHAGRKHGFAVAEAVAGRVKEFAHGTVVVDLFGKAIAFADEHEPREVPPLPEPPRDAEAARTTAAGTAAPQAGEEPAAEPQPSTESAPAEAAGSPEPTAEGAAAAAGQEEQAPAAVEEAPVAAAEAAEGAPAETAEAMDSSAGTESAPEDAEDGEGESTLSGEQAPGHGPLAAAPLVPEEFPRLEPPRLGSVFRGRVGAIAESGHIALVNRLLDRKAVLANLERYRTERRRVQGLVFGFNRGGFDVLVEGIRAFCPASAMALEDIEDPAVLLGQKLEFLLPASQSVSKDIVVSRRSILERQLRKKARELVRSLQPGQKLKGRVTQVREFGLFVDIGGVEGLVHQSELSYGHGQRPGDVARAGDEVDVQVLRVGVDARDSGKRDRLPRVSLSMKALLPDPWDAHADALREGTAQKGKVTRTTDFGAFIELAPSIEGLLHITELGRDLAHANQAVKEGDELHVVVERVDRQARRISLSKLSQQELEELQAGTVGGEAPRSVKPGSRITVKVARVEARGLVVRVAGVLGKRARGYVPASELGGSRGGDLRKLHPVGSELEVKIVGIDRDGGLRCSPKALEVDDERKAVKDYRREAAKQGFGTFGDLLRAKLGQADQK